jgi:predicted nucleic acid-binding protein
MKRLVADTGPILHLHEAGALQLFPLIGKVFLPPVVIAELRAHSPSLWPDAFPEWAQTQTLLSENQQRALQWRRAGLLHGGEAESLALTLQIKPDWFLTDDAAARLMAESLGMEAHGSIGVVLWAAANNLITKSEAEKYLTGLGQSSLWISRKIRAQARAALEKLFAAK